MCKLTTPCVLRHTFFIPGMLENFHHYNQIMRSYACALGVTLLFTRYTGSCYKWQCCIARMVVINGLLCHLTGANSFRIHDVLCNATAILFVNATTEWQPYTLLCTCIACIMWTINEYTLHNASIHILLVQGSMSLALAHLTC